MKKKKEKVWDVISKNFKEDPKKSHSVNHHVTVTRKVIPLFVDDDNKVIQRENIVNMHNVFMKETKNEYTNAHMNNLFSMLFANKKHYKIKRSNELPLLKSRSPKSIKKVTHIKNYSETHNNNYDCQLDSFDSQIEENKKEVNRNKIVIKLKKAFPFFKTKNEILTKKKENLLDRFTINTFRKNANNNRLLFGNNGSTKSSLSIYTSKNFEHTHRYNLSVKKKDKKKEDYLKKEQAHKYIHTFMTINKGVKFSL